MKSTIFRLTLLIGAVLVVFSFADARASVNSGNILPVQVNNSADTSITTDNYIPHIKKHPRHHRRWWRRHHRRRRHW